ncbi:MAG: DUF2065 domain-containing protein [Proteobacteria bacterium]|jgi:uncharacterized protein YjeT (DUF2065 family)|nr:DUF2065 domain-containing protein [Pseudomonadota bacterium]
MWQDFFSALALMLVFEGIMPFLNPQHFRRGLMMAANLDDVTLRALGLVGMVVGVGILYVSR